MESINESDWSFPAVEEVWPRQLCSRRGCGNCFFLFFFPDDSARLESRIKTTRKLKKLKRKTKKTLYSFQSPRAKSPPPQPSLPHPFFFFISHSVFLSRLPFHHVRHLLQSASPGVVLVLHHIPLQPTTRQRPEGCQIKKKKKK